MKVKFFASFGLVGCRHEDEFEFPDDLSDEELEEQWKEWVWQYIDGYYEKQKE